MSSLPELCMASTRVETVDSNTLEQGPRVPSGTISVHCWRYSEINSQEWERRGSGSLCGHGRRKREDAPADGAVPVWGGPGEDEGEHRDCDGGGLPFGAAPRRSWACADTCRLSSGRGAQIQSGWGAPAPGWVEQDVDKWDKRTGEQCQGCLDVSLADEELVQCRTSGAEIRERQASVTHLFSWCLPVVLAPGHRGLGPHPVVLW